MTEKWSSDDPQRQPPVPAGREEEPAPPRSAAERIRESTEGRQVCPYCGTMRESAEGACGRCGMEDTAATRQATRARLGPWYVLQARNPAAPGMSFATLLALVRKGQVSPTSVVRGPTTQQMWTFAAQVKGLSREFGVCYGCGQEVARSDNLCPHCQRLQEPPINVDALLEGKGLSVPPPARPGAVRQKASPPPGTDIARGGGDVLGLPPEQLAAAISRLPAAGNDAPVRPAGERILTPKELAAAFAIPPEEKGAVAGEKAPEGSRAKKRRWGRWFMLLLLLGAGGAGAAYLAHDPAARERAAERLTMAEDWTRVHVTKAVEWFKGEEMALTREAKPREVKKAQGTKAEERPSVAREERASVPAHPAIEQAKPAGAAREPLASADEGTSSQALSRAPAGGQAVMGKRSAEAAPPAATPPAAAAPAAAAAPVTSMSRGAAPASPGPVESQVRVGPPPVNAAPPAATVTPAAPKTENAVRASVTQQPAGSQPPAPQAASQAAEAKASADQVQRSMDLFRRALESESHNDFSAAVRLYEQIEALPREVWPATLERRLSAAKQRAGGG